MTSRHILSKSSTFWSNLKLIPFTNSRYFYRRLSSNAEHADTNSQPEEPCYDVLIVGGGVVGCATARELINTHPHLKFGVLEKEKEVAMHQSGHNSGVIHAGIYYTPGSLKARLCVKGSQMTYKYCDENDIPYKKCGKLIVATNPDEVSRLQGLLERGIQNEVPGISIIGPEEIREIEPNCVGLKALNSPITGIVDWGVMTRSYADNFTKAGGTIHTNQKVTGFEESHLSDYPVRIKTEHGTFHAGNVITCGGLFADRLSALSGCSRNPRIVPFRGEYLVLKPEKSDLVNGNIYPVPDPRFPFLGVHFTPRMDGSIWLGPNAVLAFKREGYSLFDINAYDFFEAASFRGLQKLVLKNIGYAVGELYRGINPAAQVKILQKFVPSLCVADVTRGPSGVRAQALDVDGSLVDDFIFDSGSTSVSARMLHVRNAPSPAATSSLAIAEVIATEAKERFRL